jgi:hypothetical protein
VCVLRIDSNANRDPPSHNHDELQRNDNDVVDSTNKLRWLMVVMVVVMVVRVGMQCGCGWQRRIVIGVAQESIHQCNSRLIQQRLSLASSSLLLYSSSCCSRHRCNTLRPTTMSASCFAVERSVGLNWNMQSGASSRALVQLQSRTLSHSLASRIPNNTNSA